MRCFLDKLAAMGERTAPGLWVALCVLLCLALCLDAAWWRSLPLGVAWLGPAWLLLGGVGWLAGAAQLRARGRNPIFWLVVLPFGVISFATWGTVWYLKHPGATFVPDALLWAGFSFGLILVLAAAFTVRWFQRQLGWTRLTFWGLGCLALIPVWQFGLFATEFFGWELVRFYIARVGLAAIFLSGLAWTIRWVDIKARQIDEQRVAAEPSSASRTWRIGPLEAMNHCAAPVQSRVGNPLDLGAWYYGRANQKLKQSLNTTASYTIAFVLIALLLMLLPGCLDIYELPAGGGDPQLKRKKVVVQKVKKRVYVVNPFSAILFNPDIERIQLKLEELTKHLYDAGQGKGKGPGFAGGTRRGMVRFIRLKYSSGDWDQDLDLNSDLNMLIWYAAQTGHKTAKKPEVRTVRQLAAFPVGKSPPMVYLTGQRSLSLSRAEIETLREYLTTKHGMLFADNGGSPGWHSQFFNLMRQVLPRTDPRTVPLDHPVHDGMPFLPIVAPHGGRTAYMWVVENRIVAYYHPGDIGDAWADGHAGVPRPVWEACYRLGGNIILYSHSEYSKWLQSQKKKD
jgi:hypothetical protein